jgi:hypothetical protein
LVTLHRSAVDAEQRRGEAQIAARCIQHTCNVASDHAVETRVVYAPHPEKGQRKILSVSRTCATPTSGSRASTTFLR